MPVVFVRILVPVWDRFATPVAVGAFGRHGATQDLAQRGVGRSGRESVMAVGRFCRNAVGPPEWEWEAMGSVVWVQCANLCRVCVLNLSIAAPADMGPVRSWLHYGSTVIIIICLLTTLVR